MNNQNVLATGLANVVKQSGPAGESVVGVIEIAGVPPLTMEQHRGFDYLHHYLFFPQPNWLTELRATREGERWYIRFVGGIFDNVQSARLAVEYHLSQVEEIEAAVHDFLHRQDLTVIPVGQTVGIGNTQKLEFEYHAYVFAYRRTLEYVARAIAGYFRCDCSSFNRLSKVLRAQVAQRSVASCVQDVCDTYRERFAFVVSEGNSGQSVRDRISHYEFTSAGSYNLTRDGFRLIGGGELLGLGDTAATLSEALRIRLEYLDAFLRELLCAFTDAVRAANN